MLTPTIRTQSTALCAVCDAGRLIGNTNTEEREEPSLMYKTDLFLRQRDVILVNSWVPIS